MVSMVKEKGVIRIEKNPNVSIPITPCSMFDMTFCHWECAFEHKGN